MEDADKNTRKQRCSENKPTAEIKWLGTGEKGQAGKFLLTSGQECMCSTSHSCDILHAGGEVSPTSAPPRHSVPPEASDHTEGVPIHGTGVAEKVPVSGRTLALAEGGVTTVLPTGMNWWFFSLKVTCREGGGCV